MPIFSNAQGLVINNSQFTDQQINQVASGPTGIDILFGATIPEAAYNSSARDQPPLCFPGTREQHIEDIVHWAIPAIGSTPSPIFRMNGPAGVGKSAIAQTCVEKIKAEGKLGAAFFFSIDGRNQHTHFFTTVAYQLTTVFPDYHNLIERKLRRDRTLIDKAVASQFWELIVEPLRELERNGKGIGNRIPIFVDGLDECEDERAQCTIIEVIATAARDGATPLCWAFFSRPEPHIEATFSKTDIAVLCHTVTILPDSSEAKREIELYLRAGFEDILRRHNISPDHPWPSDNNIKTLTNATNGLFVYAATTLRFIDRTGSHGPEGPLREVLAVISQNGTTTAPFAELDAFYTLIMRRIPAKILLHVRLLLAILCHLDSSPSAIVMANLLRLSKMEHQTICNRLSAVLRVSDQSEIFKLEDGIRTNQPYYQHPKISLDALGKLSDSIFFRSGGRMTFYHKSFRDFLIDPKRSDVFWFEPCAIYPVLFNHCYKLRLDFENCYRLCDSSESSGIILIPSCL
ncbi:hypothetical protein P691DRAFT_683055 [Macrolepiota fuliginosa MF-IS2]|uniref:Nephrocystin 3-like N-terminal domain-containing protein n=1 Tax=Macrolepiota fuliginosa MF-IS2 TaxID=1400762 RepID=A0A9P5X1H0_9AGAR|nr:hypothetical protein P691DRAFT_683055 [Macrolepiota fuliginosa MF-IS2]